MYVYWFACFTAGVLGGCVGGCWVTFLFGVVGVFVVCFVLFANFCSLFVWLRVGILCGGYLCPYIPFVDCLGFVFYGVCHGLMFVMFGCLTYTCLNGLLCFLLITLEFLFFTIATLLFM